MRGSGACGSSWSPEQRQTHTQACRCLSWFTGNFRRTPIATKVRYRGIPPRRLALTSRIERTATRLRQLLEREFLYESPVDELYCANIWYMFNGNRLTFIRGYKLKGASAQAELPLEETLALAAPTQLSTCAVENTDDFDDTCANAANRDVGQVGDYEFSGFRFASWTPSVWKLLSEVTLR